MKLLVTCAVAASVTAGLVAEGKPTSTQESQLATTSAGPMLHLEGCIFLEGEEWSTRRSVPVGTVGNYILGGIKVISGPEDLAPADRVFRLEQVAPDRLRDLFRKRVGVTGRIGEGAETSTLVVTSIRPISGACSRPRAAGA